MFLLSISKKLKNTPPMHKQQKTAIGTGALISAIPGAKIVINLAKKLLIPKAVAENKVGYISALAMYTIVKLAAMPPLASVINTGTHFTSSTPKNSIKLPPIKAIV